MKGITHMAGGALASAVVITRLYPEISLAALGAAVALGAAAGLVPDIDHPNSKISHKLRLSSKIVNILFKHRGFFHTPILYLGLGAVLWFLLPLSLQLYILAFVSGALSHILLDSLNPVGVPLLFPLSKKKLSLLKIRTGTKGDSLVGALCWIGVSVVGIKFVG